MNVKEMTNEELAVYFFNAAEGGTTLFKRCLREAATRLRDLKPCNKNFKCDSLEELLTAEKRKNAELLGKIRVVEDALKVICVKANGILIVRHVAKNALAAIRKRRSS